MALLLLPVLAVEVVGALGFPGKSRSVDLTHDSNVWCIGAAAGGGAPGGAAAGGGAFDGPIDGAAAGGGAIDGQGICSCGFSLVLPGFVAPYLHQAAAGGGALDGAAARMGGCELDRCFLGGFSWSSGGVVGTKHRFF